MISFSTIFAKYDLDVVIGSSLPAQLKEVNLVISSGALSKHEAPIDYRTGPSQLEICQTIHWEDPTGWATAASAAPPSHSQYSLLPYDKPPFLFLGKSNLSRQIAASS